MAFGVGASWWMLGVRVCALALSIAIAAPQTARAQSELGGLERDPSRWSTGYCEVEGAPVPRCDPPIVIEPPSLVPAVAPSGGGNALRIGLEDGPAYTNAAFWRVLPPDPADPANVVANGKFFELDLWLTYDPATTFNNQPDPSRIQAIEVALNVYQAQLGGRIVRYEAAVQWRNVLDTPGAPPAWYAWANRPNGTCCAWQPLNLPDSIGHGFWHRVVLRAEVVGTQLRVQPVVLGQHGESALAGVSWQVAQRSHSGQVPEATVAVQLDGAEILPGGNGYAVLLDDVRVRWWP